MKLALREAKTRLSELVAAASNGEHAIITKHGRPVVELVPCNQRVGGIDFEKLEKKRRKLGIVDGGEGWPEQYNDPAFSRQVLGVDK